MTLSTRWLIRGRLTTLTPLHLGSGATTERTGYVNEVDGEPVQINDVARDHRGLPYLPATALKGALRRRLEARGISREVLDPLLGHPVDEENEAAQRGGLAELWDAFLDAPFRPDPAPPDWDGARSTDVAARVSIDRRTGTAAHQRLFHLESVPPGAAFDVSLAGALTEDQLVLLLSALEDFNDPDLPLTLGAETVDGWGRLRWEPLEVRHLDAQGALRWVQAGAPSAGYGMLDPLPPAQQDRLFRRAADSASGSSPAPVHLILDLALELQGPFLVNDPRRTGSGEELPDHAPLLDPQGRPFLPATSFRGVLRSQAERILRTVRGPEAACGPGTRRPPCTPPESLDGIHALCPACRVFGAAGWRSPLRLTDFRSDEATPGEPWRQEFLAIDRFTGGGASEWQGLDAGYTGLKFNAEGRYRPVLRGRVRIDLAALDRARCTSWSLALLALSLRDLIEGDLAFGWGVGKGYGQCTARIDDVLVPAADSLPDKLRIELEQLQVSEDELQGRAPEHLLDPNTDLGIALMWAIGELKNVALGADGKEHR